MTSTVDRYVGFRFSLLHCLIIQLMVGVALAAIIGPIEVVSLGMLLAVSLYAVLLSRRRQQDIMAALGSAFVAMMATAARFWLDLYDLKLVFNRHVIISSGIVGVSVLSFALASLLIIRGDRRGYILLLLIIVAGGTLLMATGPE